jgi:cobalamin biosynthesis Mg chelatase CobN
MQMLVKDPDVRFPNGGALALAVSQVRSGSYAGRPAPADTRGRADSRGPAKTRAVPVAARAAAAGVRTPAPAATRIQPMVSGQSAMPKPVAHSQSGPHAQPVDSSRRAAAPAPQRRAGQQSGNNYRGQPAPSAQPVRTASRGTGVSVLLAIVVLILAGLALVVLNELAGGL